MNLLKAALYDPAAAVSKATSSLLAMTAFDTTNLRLAITVPAHGMVRFRLRCVITGATTCPTILLGVLNGATVVGRCTPAYENATANATTQGFLCDVEFTATGLTPGAMNVDAAYGVEVVVAATNIKYGGPNDTTGNNAWGGFVFEAWDPQPQTTTGQLSVDASGRVDVGKVLGTAQTAGDLKASLNTLQTDTDDIQTRLPAALVGGRMDSSVGAMAANVLTAAAIAAAALNGKGDWLTGDSSGVTTLLARLTAGRATNLDNLDATVSSRSTYAGGDTAGVTTLLTRLSAARALLLDNLDAAISSRSTYAGADTAGTTTLLARLSAARALLLDNLDATVSSRLASAGYTAPNNAGITAIQAKTDNLPSDPADESLIIAATDAIIALVNLVKAKTDNLPVDPADESLLEAAIAGVAAGVLAAATAAPIAANVKKVNGTTVNGDGSSGTPWGP